MNQAAEPRATSDLTERLRQPRVALRWLQLQSTMRPSAVVVVDELTEHPLQVAATEDDQPVKTFAAALSTQRSA